MFKNRSKVLFVCNVLTTIYVIYLLCHFLGTTTSSDSAEALGGAIATTIVMPHIFFMLLGAIFGWLGFFMKKNWGVLVGAILYCVGAFMFLLYAMFSIPIIILGFVGYSNQKKLNDNK